MDPLTVTAAVLAFTAAVGFAAVGPAQEPAPSSAGTPATTTPPAARPTSSTATSTTPPPGSPAPTGAPPPGVVGVGLPVGTARVDMDVVWLGQDIPLGTDRSLDGAVTAFTEYVVWLVGSPAAEVSGGAFRRLSTGTVYPGLGDTVALLAEPGGQRFEATAGAYRRLGWSGSEQTPDAVMIEVIAPYGDTFQDRWLCIGGLVTWTPDGWLIDSMLPREVRQPFDGARTLTSEQKATLFEGPGWTEFAGA
ncbi:hypothetical protein [Goekera deserti]|uniref:hypothetical protein n=1 Tax=Goekera deserti TaxID=2497753 RepID=UPI00128B1EAA|nr:hypothetical protein [Goekera deserti]